MKDVKRREESYKNESDKEREAQEALEQKIAGTL